MKHRKEKKSADTFASTQYYFIFFLHVRILRFILGTPTLNIFNNLSTPLKNEFSEYDIESDENNIDMNVILNPKLSSTRIERPRRVHVSYPTSPPPKVTNDYYNKAVNHHVQNTQCNKKSVSSTNVHSNNSSKNEREHSDIIEKVLAGIPLTDNEIRRVIHRPK